MTDLRTGVLVWWRDCICDTDWCAYDDGACPMCQLLAGAGLPCPRDEAYGVIEPPAGQLAGGSEQ